MSLPVPLPLSWQRTRHNAVNFATGFKAENLILEITETGVMADTAIALDAMTRLGLKGFKLSIDDFGTGYSSVEQLQRISFGELKLDRSFVQGAVEQLLD